MSFLEQLKAQKGLGSKPVPPPVVETEPEAHEDLPDTVVVEEPKVPVGHKPHRVEAWEVVLADGNRIEAGDLLKGTYVQCLNCRKVAGYLVRGPSSTYKHGRFCSTRCMNAYPWDLKWCWNKPTEPNAEPVQTPVESSMTREKWLEEAMSKIEQRIFAMEGQVAVPRCRVSVGFPAGSRKRVVNKTEGQYWPRASASDGVPQIFISPSSGASSDPVHMLAVLVHEMVHACTEGNGHGKDFRRLALKVGLQGPMRSTSASAQLKKKLKTIAEELGPFPHGTIDPTTRPGKKGKLKGYECPSCKMKVYTTQKWIDLSHGTISCPSQVCDGSDMFFVPPKS